MGTSAPTLEMLAHVRVVRELGARAPGTYLGEVSGGTHVVLETYANLDSQVMQRIGESAKQLCGMKHPHLVEVLSVERIGGWSVVTEHVDGVPLAEVFFAMSLGARLRAVVDVLTALSALHLRQTVHGGLLARAAFVDKHGRTKLGFAYRSAMCVGKDTYAPEALLSDVSAIGPQTDVYGAGVLLWEAVTGRALFGADAPDLVLKKQLAGRIDKALPAACDRWARSLLPVIDRALVIDPKARYGSIAEMAAALRIAVRARLMFHEDIIEELWPAQTVPKLTSGVQPTAMSDGDADRASPEVQAKLEREPEPLPTAPLSMDTSPAVEGAISGLVPLEPARLAGAARTTPSALAGAVVMAVVLLVVAVVASFILRRPYTGTEPALREPPAARAAPATDIATPPPTATSEAAHAPNAPTHAAVSGAVTSPAPPAPSTPHKATKHSGHATGAPRNYDPSSI